MPKQKTLAEVRAQIAKTENDIRQGENKVKRLLQQNKKDERSARTRRLIERGAILESLVPDAAMFSNGQIKELLKHALGTDAVNRMVSGYKAPACDGGGVGIASVAAPTTACK